MSHQVYDSKIQRFALRLYLCVLYGSQNKQRLFPYITSNDLIFITRGIVFTARYELGL